MRAIRALNGVAAKHTIYASSTVRTQCHALGVQGPRALSSAVRTSGVTGRDKLDTASQSSGKHQCRTQATVAASVPHDTSTLTTSLPHRTTVSLDGQNHEYSSVLLRDLCECPACVHVDTKQRLFSTADIPINIEARSVQTCETDPDSVKILWRNDASGFRADHTTTVGKDILRKINISGLVGTAFEVPPSPPTQWKDGVSNLPDYAYDAYMNDDSTLRNVIEQLQTHGLVFITKVPGTEKSVSTIAERIGPIKDTFYGKTWDVRTVPKAINAAYTSGDLGFHTDLLYFDNPAHIQLLHCIQSSSTGGASVFADAFQAAQELYETDIDAFNTLATLPVNYHYKHVDSNLYGATKPVFDLRPLKVGNTTYSTLSDFLAAWEHNRLSLLRRDKSSNTIDASGSDSPEAPNPLQPLTIFDCLDKINWGPPFQAPLSINQTSMERASTSPSSSSSSPREALNQKMDAWHSAARKFNHLLQRREMLHERLMKPGECVLFNNTRVLHSRRAFGAEDAGKARWLRGTYVDKDAFLSKYRVLRGKMKGGGR